MLHIYIYIYIYDISRLSVNINTAGDLCKIESNSGKHTNWYTDRVLANRDNDYSIFMPVLCQSSKKCPDRLWGPPISLLNEYHWLVTWRWPGCESDHSFHLMSRLRVSGAVPPLPAYAFRVRTGTTVLLQFHIHCRDCIWCRCSECSLCLHFVWAYYNSHICTVIYFKLLATLAVEPLSLSITVVFANH